jgi:hypothetical protein
VSVEACCAVCCGGPTYGIGDLAHGIVAHVEVAETSAFDKAGRESREEIVGKSESVRSACLSHSRRRRRQARAAGACVPFNLGPDDIDDLVRQAGNVLVAQVNRNTWLLLLQFPGRLGGRTMVNVLAGVLKGRLGECHHLLVRDGRGRVVAHDERTRTVRGESIMAVVVAYMLFAWTATVQLN